MLVKQEFKVDLIDLKNAAFPEKVLEVIKEQAAEGFGKALEKIFPYNKNEERSFKGALPEMSFNREHQFTDVYEQRLVILTEEDAREMRTYIIRSNMPHEKIFEFDKLLT